MPILSFGHSSTEAVESVKDAKPAEIRTHGRSFRVVLPSVYNALDHPTVGRLSISTAGRRACTSNVTMAWPVQKFLQLTDFVFERFNVC